MYRCGLLAVTLIVLISASAAQAKRCTHRVKTGEFLGTIANKYKVSVAKLKHYNGLKSDTIHPGDLLRIRPCQSNKKKARRRLSRRSRAANKATRTKRLAYRHHSAGHHYVSIRRRYRVRSGDSAWKIAKRFRMSPGQLSRLNRGKKLALLRPGKAIWIRERRLVKTDKEIEGLLKLHEGPGYHVRNPSRSWGTFLTVTTLQDVFSQYASIFPQGPEVSVHDLSRQRGGYLAPHVSHHEGRDVDIPFVRTKTGSIDWERNWFLIKSLIETEDVQYIFINFAVQRRLYRFARSQGEDLEWLDRVFQYPQRARVGIIRHEPGHHRHFHVRFREAPPEAIPVG